MGQSHSWRAQVHHVRSPRCTRQADGLRRNLSHRRHQVRRARRLAERSPQAHPGKPRQVSAAHLRRNRSRRHLRDVAVIRRLHQIWLPRRSHPAGAAHVYLPGAFPHSRLRSHLRRDAGGRLLDHSPPRRSGRSRRSWRRQTGWKGRCPMTAPKFRFTFWKAIFLLIMVTAVYATWVRFRHGLGASTNLSDQFPWGLWIGFDVMCGVMLAAGGFTLTAAVEIFNIKRWHSIMRPTILTAFMGYLLVCAALMYDLGLPWNIWHPLIMRNPHSVMFEVAYCVMLYTTVLALEFSPIVFERLGWKKPLML